MIFSSFSWTFLLLLYIIIVKKYKTAVPFAISKHWIIVNVKCIKLQLTQYYNMHPVLCTIITLILYKNALIINWKSIDMVAPSSLDGNSLWKLFFIPWGWGLVVLKKQNLDIVIYVINVYCFVLLNFYPKCMTQTVRYLSYLSFQVSVAFLKFYDVAKSKSKINYSDS